MAEGWARSLKGDVIEPYSAGIDARGLDAHAVKVMAEAGVAISKYRSRRVHELKEVVFEYVFTVCDSAHESCPVFPGRVKRLHAGFDSPPRTRRDDETRKKTPVNRRVRDATRKFVDTLPGSLENGSGSVHHYPMIHFLIVKGGKNL